MLTSLSIPSPSNGIWYLGPVPIRGYALSIILGIIVAIWLAERRWVARGGQSGEIADLAVWGIPFGLIGGRLYHVLTDHNLYFGEGKHPIEALYIWRGGLGIWGAIAMGALGIIIAARRKGIRLLPVLDAIAPTVLVAQAIGREVILLLSDRLLPLGKSKRFRTEIYKDRIDYPGAWNRLGVDAAIGVRAWDPQGRIVVRIGPLDYQSFSTLLPDKSGLQRLVSLIRAYLGYEIGFAVNPILMRSEIPPLQLGAESGAPPRLGWNTWMPLSAPAIPGVVRRDSRHEADGCRTAEEKSPAQIVHCRPACIVGNLPVGRPLRQYVIVKNSAYGKEVRREAGTAARHPGHDGAADPVHRTGQRV